MRCTRTQNNLNAYLAGELNRKQMEQVREHLMTCSLCAQELSTLEKLNKNIDQLEKIKPSPEFEAQFWRRVKETKQQESTSLWRPGLSWTPRLKWSLSTAFAVLFMFGIYITWEGFQNLKNQRGVDPSIEIVEIEKDIDFYQQYDIIKEMDILVTFDNDETMYKNGNTSGNHTL